ncbi:hypothetical protein C0993_008574 [Termitomyces sp. T159_Od127]|nr:hypothetical protein C0993_008574 [Termitomyces sp. T159_Od127]
MALSLDTLLAHLTSQSSQTLLLHTTLLSSSASVNTLVDSSATDNFIDESLAMLAAMPWRLPLPIGLPLFDGSSTFAGDITHYIQTTLTFANSHLSWLHSTNPRINWWNLTLHFDHQTLECPEPIPFDVTAPVSATNHPHTPLQLCSKSTWLLVLNAQLSKFSQVLTTLIDSRAIRMFVSDQLNLTYNPLNRPMELQLFNCKPTTAGPITKTHSSFIVLNNSLWFLVDLLVTQLPETTPIVLAIVLGLPWLCDVNPNTDCRNLTMKFPGPSACLTAVHLCLQPTNDPIKARATGAPTAPPNNSGNHLSPRHILGAPPVFPLNIPHNKYKGSNYPT